MSVQWKKIWSSIGVSGLILIAVFGNLLYMNVRSSDPILEGWQQYSSDRFSRMLKHGEPVLVEVYAPWCPTCLAQHSAFEELIQTGRAPKIAAIRVDYDQDKDFISAYSIRGTGHLLIFSDGNLVSSASGLVTPDSIERFLRPYYR